ncbi:hypothetical protein Taro_055154 [Colocasia esculenta]|uniref:Uncharacterized protein n=1 Tax=Colocasia esculenta TaxID=4460 RepID=A0A843XS32_COLES|nr:hypothetical protein [Colocasia esculenta]
MHVLKVTYCRGHWNLLILCNFGNSFNNNYSLCMILLDSLIISEPLKAEPTIRRIYITHRASWLVLKPLALFRFYFRRYHNKGMERSEVSSHSITYISF